MPSTRNRRANSIIYEIIKFLLNDPMIWLCFIIVFTVLFIILVLVIIVTRDRVILAIALIEEGNK